MRKLSTGEPCAGEPLARFGGSGESGKTLLYPYTTARMQEVEQRRSSCREDWGELLCFALSSYVISWSGFLKWC